MFDFVRNNQRVLQFLLVLLIFPSFVFLGLQGYEGFREGGQDVAQVAGQPISQAEWDNAHRSTIDRLRQQDPKLDVRELDTPEVRRQTLDSLVRERVMLVAAQDQHLGTTDERLARLFQANPDFAFLRNPDGTLNRSLIEAQGMSVPQFEARLRQDLATRQVLLGIAGSPTGSRVAAELALDALMQRREVRVAKFEAGRFREQVQPTDAEIEAHYQDPAHTEALSAPERLKLEYVVLDATQLAARIEVSEAEVQAFYEANSARYSQPEERRASHILIKSDPKDPADKRAAAKAQAADLLKQLRDNPKRFAELAKAHSQDTGSASRGGDLDYFGRGAMVKPFEDMAFSMPAGAISELVETDFGFHIIQVTGQRGNGKRSLAEAREEIEGELRKERAQKLYAEQAETFSNMVYEQSDSLQPVAEKLGLKIETAALSARTPIKDETGPTGNARFVSAVFADAVLKDKRNSEAVELGPNRLAAGRAVDYRAKRKLSLEEAREVVRSRVAFAKAAELARKDGQAKLAAWQTPDGAAAGEQALGELLLVSRPDPKTLAPQALDAVMRAPADKLPAWLGVDLGEDGYAVIRVEKVLPRDPATGDPKQLRSQYAELWTSVESEAYYEALKARHKVRIEAAPAAASAAEAAAR